MAGRKRANHSVEKRWLVRVVRRGKILFQAETNRATKIEELKQRAVHASGELPEVTPTYYEYRAWLTELMADGTVRESRRTFSHRNLNKAQAAAEHAQEQLLREAIQAGLDPERYPLGDTVRMQWRAIQRSLWQERTGGRAREDRLSITGAPTLEFIIEENLNRKRNNKSIEGSTLATDRSFFENWVKRKFLRSEVAGMSEFPYALADVQISRLTQPMIQEFVDVLSRVEHKHGKDGLSRSTIENILAVVGSAWRSLRNHPRYKEFYSAVNFRDDVILPKKALVRPNSRYTFDEVEQLIAACHNELDSAVLALSLLGIRAPSEVAGITVDDFFDYREFIFLRVHQQIDVVDKVRVLKPYTKTGSKGSDEGVRQLLVLPRLWEMIRPCAETARRLGYRFIIHSASGTGDAYGSVDPHVIQRRFAEIRRIAEVSRKGATLYALRKTVASHAKEVGGTDLAQIIGGWRGTGVFSRHYDASEMLDFQVEHMPKLRWAQVSSPTGRAESKVPRVIARAKSKLDEFLGEES
ncbi:MAG: hypothetical protein M9921_08135 [Fimbriimonadaceae bacterium]|nr:hypothetical protein [Fimbriimonadaceae bacterium]